MKFFFHIPQVWDLIEHFKSWCRSRGWKTFKYEDLVEVGGKYHNFLWIQHVNFNTFKKVIMNPLCSICEGISYRTVSVSYTAWVLPESPPENMGRMVLEKTSLSRRVAIYDLDQAYAGRDFCLKLNETDSVVFQEFERFLNREYEIEFRPICKLPPLPPESIPTQPLELSH